MVKYSVFDVKRHFATSLIHRQLALVKILQCDVKYCEESIIVGNSAKNCGKILGMFIPR